MIGELYDVNNVVVGQAACLIAPAFTPLPSVAGVSQIDPFDPTPFLSRTLTVGATSTYTLSHAGNTTTSLATAATGAAIRAALEALPSIGAGHVAVTGTVSPYVIELDEHAALNGQVTVNVTTGTAALTGGLWTPVGATDQGWKYGTNKSTQSITVEEQSTPVANTINTQSVTIEGALSEDVTATLALAYNGIVSRTAAVTGSPGYDQIVLTDDILYYAVVLLAATFDGRPRWIYAPKWSQLSNVSTDFRRANSKRMYPVSFGTLCKPGEIVVRNFTANALP